MSELDLLLKFKPTGIKASKGRILLSEPFIPNAIFKRSVLLLADHGEKGSFGLIINKPTEYSISEVAFDFPNCDMPVYLGGPVESDHLFFLHTSTEIVDSFEVLPGLYWGGNLDQIKLMIHTKELTSANFRFFLGYSGWTEEQLETELNQESWIVSEAHVSDVFGENPHQLWTTLIKRFGDTYLNWLKIPINPQMN